MAEQERGSASIFVTLQNGRIVVRHGEDGTVLFDREVAHGTWAHMWRVIRDGAMVAVIEKKGRK